MKLANLGGAGWPCLFGAILPVELEVLPELLEEAVVVPLVVGRDGHAVRDVADDVQFLDRYLVNLVQQVDAGDVGPGGHIQWNNFGLSSVLPDGNFCRQIW